MDALPLNILDLGVLVILALGALVGLALGFVKGGLFILSWLGAIVATIAWFPMAQPYGRQYIETPWIADVTSGGALFLVVLVFLFLISSVIGSWVRSSRLNALDRSLGMVAGLATAVLVVCSVFVVLDSTWSEDERPAWVVAARSLPLIEAGAEPLRALIPGVAKKKAGETRDKARKMLETEKLLRDMIAPTPKGDDADKPAGYGNKERKAMDQAIESVR